MIASPEILSRLAGLEMSLNSSRNNGKMMPEISSSTTETPSPLLALSTAIRQFFSSRYLEASKRFATLRSAVVRGDTQVSETSGLMLSPVLA